MIEVEEQLNDSVERVEPLAAYWRGVDPWEGELPVVDDTQPYLLPDFTLAYDGVGFAPLGGVQMLDGRQGNGKTMVFSMLMAAILGGQYGSLAWCGSVQRPVVLYVDTEQEMGFTLSVIRRVKRMAAFVEGLHEERLVTLNLRNGFSPKRRWSAVCQAVRLYKPAVVFLDGMLDLVKDFNDNAEAATMVQRCMDIASEANASVWCVVHQNRQGTSMGHIGGALERKASDALSVTKERNGALAPTFCIRHVKARSRDLPDIYFHVEHGADGLPVPVLDNPAADEGKFPALAVQMENVFKQLGGGEHNVREVLGAIKAIYNIGGSKAAEMLKIAGERGIVSITGGKGRNGMVCVLNNTDKQDTDEEDELPF